MKYIFLICLLSSQILAQDDCDYSNLRMQSLELIFNSCEGLLHDFPCELTVSKVNVDVICDHQDRLDIQVNFNAQNSGWVKAQAFDRSGKIISAIRSEVTQVHPNQAKTVSLSLLDESLPGFETSFIELHIASSRSRLHQLRSTRLRFDCPKKWGEQKNILQNGKTQFNSRGPITKVIPKYTNEFTENSNLRFRDKEILDLNKNLTLNDIIPGSTQSGLDQLLGVGNLFLSNNDQLYVIPDEFGLLWSPKSGFNTKHIYSKKSGTESSIKFFAQISTKLNEENVSILNRILHSSGIESKGLSLLPVTGVNISHDWLSLYQVSPSIHKLGNDINDQLAIEFNTDRTTIANIGLALTNHIGLNGSIHYSTENNALPEIEIPFAINLKKKGAQIIEANSIKKGSVENRYWVNESCYPLKLKALNFLVEEKNGDLRNITGIKEYTLRNRENDYAIIPPKGRVYISLNEELEQLLSKNNSVILRWITFEVIDDIGCDASIVNSIVNSALDVEGFLTIKAMESLFKKTRINEMQIEVASNQFSPTNTQTIRHSMHFKESGEKQFGPFFFRDSKANLNYKYRIKLIDDEGNTFSSQWKQSNEPTLYLGSAIKSDIPGFSW